jgi:hypothetical protein
MCCIVAEVDVNWNVIDVTLSCLFSIKKQYFFKYIKMLNSTWIFNFVKTKSRILRT